VAAACLEKVTGKTWEILMQEEVFDPLGIDGRFGWATDTSSGQPLGHIKPSEWGLPDSKEWVILPEELDYAIEIVEPAGDISLSMADYCLFLQENLKALKNRGRLLKQSTFKILHYGREDYAMGWGNPVIEGQHYLSHDGSAGTFYCRNLLCREKEYGIAIFANSGNNHTAKAVHKLGEMIMKIMEK